MGIDRDYDSEGQKTLRFFDEEAGQELLWVGTIPSGISVYEPPEPQTETSLKEISEFAVSVATVFGGSIYLTVNGLDHYLVGEQSKAEEVLAFLEAGVNRGRRT